MSWLRRFRRQRSREAEEGAQAAPQVTRAYAQEVRFVLHQEGCSLAVDDVQRDLSPAQLQVLHGWAGAGAVPHDSLYLGRGLTLSWDAEGRLLVEGAGPRAAALGQPDVLALVRELDAWLQARDPVVQVETEDAFSAASHELVLRQMDEPPVHWVTVPVTGENVDKPAAEVVAQEQAKEVKKKVTKTQKKGAAKAGLKVKKGDVLVYRRTGNTAEVLGFKNTPEGRKVRLRSDATGRETLAKVDGLGKNYERA